MWYIHTLHLILQPHGKGKGAERLSFDLSTLKIYFHTYFQANRLWSEREMTLNNSNCESGVLPLKSLISNLQHYCQSNDFSLYSFLYNVQHSPEEFRSLVIIFIANILSFSVENPPLPRKVSFSHIDYHEISLL